MNHPIDIYLLAQNREQFLFEILHSLENQTVRNFRLIASDISKPITKQRKEKVRAIGNKFKVFQYIKRDKPYSFSDHFKLCANEATAEYTILLHDDDILTPTFIEWASEKIKTIGRACAFAPNSSILEDNGLEKKTMHNIKEPLIIEDPNNLVQRFFAIKTAGICAFPFYIYRTHALKAALTKKLESRIYADVELLAKLIQYGPIIWFPDIQAKYRVHATNASEIDRLVDRIKLMNWIGANLSATTLEQYKDWLHARLVRYWIKRNKHYTQESIKKNLELINGKRSYFYYLYKYLHRKVRKLFFRPA